MLGVKGCVPKTLVRALPSSAYALVWLDGSKQMIAERLAERKNHYMNPDLLDSQFATLEPPVDALRITNDRAPELVIDEIMNHLEQA